MAKAKQVKESVEKPKKALSPKEQTNNQSTSSVAEIPLDAITESEFQPQLMRRTRFNVEKLEELAESIKKQGLINPITVRERDWQPHLTESGRYGAMLNKNRSDWLFVHTGNKTESEAQAWCAAHRFEIVAGERRYRAAKIAGLGSIPCFVKDLSDEAALEIQLQENLQRVDVHPLDEAFSYKFLMETQKMTVDDLTVKFGKNEKYIALRLKLNNLIPEAIKLLSDNFLPLGHAIEVAKFDAEIQTEVLKRCFDTSHTPDGWQPDPTKPFPLKKVLEKVSGEILLDLSRARFDRKDKRLRTDGLTCPKCPERTGAKNSLFAEFYEASNNSDRCLNPSCFESKTNRFVQITRDEATAKIKAEKETSADYKIPIIAWMPREQNSLEKFFGEKVLVDGEYVRIHESGELCEYAAPAIFLDNSHYFGDIINVCRDERCKEHFSRVKKSSSVSQQKEEERARLKRKQEILDIKVGESVRKKVLTAAAESFSADRWVFDDEKWRLLMISYFWNRITDSGRSAAIEALGKPKYGIDYHFQSHKSAVEYFSTKLTTDERSKLLFLCIVAHEGEMLYGNWKSQNVVIELANEFGVDYKKLDAAERLIKSPKKYMALAQDYFNKIEAGDNPEKPIFYKPEGK